MEGLMAGLIAAPWDGEIAGLRIECKNSPVVKVNAKIFTDPKSRYTKLTITHNFKDNQIDILKSVRTTWQPLPLWL